MGSCRRDGVRAEEGLSGRGRERALALEPSLDGAWRDVASLVIAAPVPVGTHLGVVINELDESFQYREQLHAERGRGTHGWAALLATSCT